MSDAGEIKKIAVFLKKLSFVVKKLYGFAKGSVTKILDGFSALVDGNNSFWGRLKGLGTLLLGIVGLQALLNPFGLMDSILRMLNLDFIIQTDNLRLTIRTHLIVIVESTVESRILVRK
ncbi:MAG: hypothetical protein CM15mV10_2160 [uncultured marine virus]|nr:MAG: hypothetical protein CM15mV10_2160 [uncultured marine virus]